MMHATLTRFIRDWLPPRVRSGLDRRFGGFTRADAWPPPTQEGWAAAAADAAAAFPTSIEQLTGAVAIGVGDPDFAALSETSRQHHDRLVQLAAVVGRVALRVGAPRILDFGGSFGTHAVALRRLLPDLRFEYTVAELPEFCERGVSLNPQVRFVNAAGVDGQKYDLVYASGSLQYAQDWRAVVATLCRATGDSLFITRTPFVFDRAGYVVIQRAYGTQYPGWVLNYREMIDEVGRHGLRLQEVFHIGRGVAVRGVPGPSVFLGLLFSRG